MAASVTVHHSAFGSERIMRLAELAGYNIHEARGRMALLWSVCTELQTNGVLTAARVRSCIGDRGDEHLVEAELAERLESGELRVKGCQGRIEWFGDQQDGRTAGGKSRAAGAPRDAKGRLLPRSPQQIQVESSSNQLSESDPDPDQKKERESLSLPEQQSARDLPDESASAEESQISIPRSSPLRVVRSPEQSLERDLHESKQFVAGQVRLNRETRAALSAIRMTVAKELGIEVRPIPAQGRGEYELNARIREAGSIEKAAADCAHVLEVIAAEARKERSVKWLTDSVFETKAWRHKLGMTLGDVRGSPSRTGGDDGPRITMPAWGDHTAPDWSPT